MGTNHWWPFEKQETKNNGIGKSEDDDLDDGSEEEVKKDGPRVGLFFIMDAR